MVTLYDIPEQYQSLPIPHQVLMDLLREYKHPNNKIYEWVKSGVLISLKRGLYQFNIGKEYAEPFLIANVLYGPSYISAESALAYHGLIPEQVFVVVSATTKKSTTFENALGVFEYVHFNTPYYSFGIEQVELKENRYVLMATPEKALIDKVASTPGVRLRSVTSAKEFLLENMRMSEENLIGLNLQTMQSWLHIVPKKSSIAQIIKAIQQL